MTIKKYIAKPDTWFDAGTKAKLLTDFGPQWPDLGLFEGLRDGKPDEEDCRFDEFDILEEES